MTKTDDVLFELKMAFVAFLNSFFPFEYENKTYRLVNNYVASPWIRCDVCRNYPTKDVSVIRGCNGQELHVGNKCIDQITNRRVSEWFKKFKTKRDNVTKNRKFIDGVTSILTANKNNELPVEIPENDVEKLQKALDRMCNGFNLTRKQEGLAECYINMSGAKSRKCRGFMPRQLYAPE